MRVIIDRFEGDFAVVEMGNGETVNMPGILVPKGAKEGDVIDIQINEEKTLERRRKIENMMKDLWRKT